MKKNKQKGLMAPDKNNIEKSDLTADSGKINFKESIGSMDCEYGYSSKKLASYFSQKYPGYYIRQSIDSEDELSENEIFPLITSNLVAFNSTLEYITSKYTNYFTRNEMELLYQNFNGILEPFNNVTLLKSAFINNLLHFDGPRFLESDEINILHEKINKIPSVEFFILSFMILEDWYFTGKDRFYKKLLKEPN